MTHNCGAQRRAAQVIYAQWRGLWHLHRAVHNDLDPRLSGVVQGSACLQGQAAHGDDGVLDYRETGLFRPQQGGVIEVQRALRFRFDDASGGLTASVRAAQGEESCPHTLHLDVLGEPGSASRWRAYGGYVCGADRYDARYLFHVDAHAYLQQVDIAHQATGPFKRYRSETQLTRSDRASLR